MNINKLESDAGQVAKWRTRAEVVAGNDSAARVAALATFGKEIRRSVLGMIDSAQLGHIGGDFSVSDILATLFGGVMKFDPARPLLASRDRFVLSKGHCAAALYSTLALSGFFDPARLTSFMAPLSPLNGHPNRRKVPGVETNTGPLGHGLPVAVGCAIAAQLENLERRTFVVLGDGELQEGSNWEAAMFAGHRKLENLCAIVDRNRLQQGAPVSATNELEPLADKWRAFGWDVLEIDGHDYAALYQAFTAPPTGKPRFVIANTIKGKGVSFMEGGVEWHHKVPSKEQVVKAYAELAS